MRKWIMGALCVMLVWTGSALAAEKGPGGKEDKADEVTGKFTGRLSSVEPETLVLLVLVKKDVEGHLNLRLTDKTEYKGLREGEKITDVPKLSEIAVVYTHKKGEPLYGTAVTVEVVRRHGE